MVMVVCKPKKRSAVYGVENEGFKEAEKNDAVVELKESKVANKCVFRFSSFIIIASCNYNRRLDMSFCILTYISCNVGLLHFVKQCASTM